MTGDLLIGYGEWGKTLAGKIRPSGIVEPDYEKWDMSGVFYATIREALEAQPTLKAAFVASPPEQHYWHAAKCLQANLDVFVEKPLGVSCAEAHELRARAGERGLRLHVNHLYRYCNPLVQFCDLVKREEIEHVDSYRLTPEPVPRHGSYYHDLLPHDETILRMLGLRGKQKVVHGGGKSFSLVVDDRHTFLTAYDSGFHVRDIDVRTKVGRTWIFCDDRQGRCHWTMYEEGHKQSPRFNWQHDALADSIARFRRPGQAPDEFDLSVVESCERLVLQSV